MDRRWRAHRSPKNQRFCELVTNAALQEQLERFWNQKEPRKKRRLTKDERECEQQFSETVRRDNTGRFVVALPKKEELLLGEPEKQAVRRLFSLERRFRVNPEVKTEYVKFMEDYQNKKHMSLVSDGEFEIEIGHLKPNGLVVLPHQPVIRPDSITTKLRVIFHASAKTSLGTALNDKLMVGPNLQNDLFNIILRFRTHQFVITADIAATFRRIIIRQESPSKNPMENRRNATNSNVSS
ncbi:uncharacterized protein LOC107267560 [Cephus cinctus]|uniref:Uncharacterized protein LOC107267560 n=1 Tax=Cephus cinctus TaxID=211228 RepID=A0AAJ7BUS4_CEPCN|nr:uncharacterized protein LOC107267560 [Cephus cinctus]